MTLSDFSVIAREGGKIVDLMKTKKPVSGRMTVDFGDFIKVLNYRYVPVFDVNNTVTSLVLMYMDITEEIQKIDEITALMIHSPYGIITIDQNLQIHDINPAFEEITGYTREQGKTMSLKDFVIKERTGLTLEDVKKSGKPARGKMVIDLPAGIKHLEYTYIPVKNRRGEISVFFEIFADVTALVNQVNESETLVSTCPASIMTFDISGKILSVNQAFIDISHIPQEKLLSMNIGDFKILNRSGGSLKNSLETKKPTRGRLTVEFDMGTRILDFTYIPLLNVDGIITKLVAIYIDLTEQVKVITYLDESVTIISDSIHKLASGDMKFSTTVLESDDTTSGAYNNMVKINSALDVARESVSRLVEDTTRLADQAIAGNLTYRADPNNHHGDYQKVITGVNQILNSITGPVNEAMRVAESYARYDFSTRVDETAGIVGDWVSFRKALDDIGNQVGDAIEKISREVEGLRKSSDMASGSVIEITQGAAQLAKNASTVSTNAEQGKEGVSQVLRAMEDLSVTVGDVSQKTEQVASLSIQSNELARTGTDLAQKAEEGMKVITENSEETARIIQEIQQEMGQIGKIVRVITDIASQTNLLALNAAIEAARAGDAGRGFAVVAAEVKALATESRSSAENIADMISSLQKKSESASSAVSLATNAVHEGNVALHETLAVFGQLASSVDEISQYMEQVASMSEEQAANAEEIAASVNEVSDLMQGTADEAVNMAGVTEETSSSLDQLKEIVHDVQSVAKGVSEAVTKFTC
jgi:methyl-accepting chemotaxis protein